MKKDVKRKDTAGQRRNDRPQDSKREKFTPLSTVRLAVLAEGEKRRLIRTPLKTKGTLGRETDKYCRYHKTARRDTEDCR